MVNHPPNYSCFNDFQALLRFLSLPLLTCTAVFDPAQVSMWFPPGSLIPF